MRISILGGQTNEGFIESEVEREEAIQSKALPWHRSAEAEPPKLQDEFPTWIKNKEYLPYASSPSNTLTGKYLLKVN